MGNSSEISAQHLPQGTHLAQGMHLALQISLLGEFALRQGETIITLDTPSYQALLAYLVVEAQHIHSRQQLAFQFWPDSSESQARTNLRKALHTLRKTLPDADCYLVADRQTVQWRCDAPCTVDVWDFEAAVAQAQQTDHSTDRQTSLEQAIDTYHGEFLPSHYDDWVLSTRETYRQQYQAALEKLLLLYEDQRQYPTAIALARKLLREDPLHEAVYRRLMRLQSLDGNVAGALRTYHACSTRLQRDLGVDPSPATREIYESLLNIEASVTAPARLPLVAREQAWSTLQSTFKQCRQGQPGVVLLTGEAGIGKTRLAEELLDWTERQGIVTITADCYPSEQQLAYAPVAKWLRNETLLPVFRRLDKRLLVECSRLLPELLDHHPGLTAPGPLTESWQRQHFFSVLAQTLLQLRQSMLLYVDDLQWCDQDTLDWLLFLVHYEPQSRFLLLGAVRSEEITAEHALNAWRQQLEREGRLTSITLERLDSQNSAQLAENVLKKELDSRQVAHLYTETEGNPLFVVEMAWASLSAGQASSQLPALPPKAQAVIETRLASLSPSAYELAQLAAVVGRSFTFNLLNQACAQSEDAVIRNLDELWQRRIIRERGIDAYDFSHDKIRQVAYGALGQARSRQFHRLVWQALETLHADDLDPVSGQIARHCEAAGRHQEAIVHYRRAANVAQAVYANQDTLNYLQRATDLLSRTKVDPKLQAEIFEQKGDVLTTIGRYEEAEAAFAKARRQHDKAFEAWQTAEKRLNQFSGDWPQTYWQEWLYIQLDRSWVLYWTNRMEDLESLLGKIHPIVKEYGTLLQQGLHYQRLVILAFRRDRCLLTDETIAYARESFATLQESGTLNQIAFSRFVLGLALNYHGWLGDFVEAESHMKSALRLARELGDVVLEIRCLFHLSQGYLRHGDLDSVASHLPRALELAKKANILEYVAMGEGLSAWFAWCKRDFAESRRFGEHSLALVTDLPFGWPGKWVACFPLISIALMHSEDEMAIEYARLPLSPDQMRFRDELTSMLQQAIDAWENNRPDAARSDLKQALRLAQEYHYL
jgi:DNA-binding SARP family transcriptional activator